jgi:uncharacterized protein (UPF0335 family)
MFVVLLSTGLAAFGGVVSIGQPSSSSSQSTAAPEAWQKEFDDICSKTQDAMTFSKEELTALISRCDALKPQIEKLDETRKKVYGERLRMCRGLYAYVLESKKKDDKK